MSRTASNNHEMKHFPLSWIMLAVWAAFLLVLQLLDLQLFTQANIVMLQRIWPFIPMVLLADWWLGRKSVVWGSAAGAIGWLIILGLVLGGPALGLA